MRPGLSYDLEVTVTDGPGGSVGAVSRLNSQQQAVSTVALPASSVRVKGHTVQVTVPAGLMSITAPPGTGPAGARTAYTFEAAVPGGQPSDVAGFAPGFVTYQAGRTRSASR